MVNERILADLRNEWESLILAFVPSLTIMMTDDLSSLLLSQDAQRAYQKSKMGHLLFGLTSMTPISNVAASHGHSST